MLFRPLAAAGLVCVAASLTACTPPRPSWVRGDVVEIHAPPRSERSERSERGPPAGISLERGGGHGVNGAVHVVQAGETLFRIALQHGVDPDELADLNEIADPKRIGVGRELVLPSPKGRKVAELASDAPTVVAAKVRRNPRAKVPPRARVIDDAPIPPVSLRWPVDGVLYSRFGPRDGEPHDGIDLAAPEGTPVVAAADGAVIYAGVQRGYGNIVILQHEHGVLTLYAHNQENLVREGQRVAAGEPIAKVGRSGRARGPHCHFEVREGTRPRDPLRFLQR